MLLQLGSHGVLAVQELVDFLSRLGYVLGDLGYLVLELLGLGIHLVELGELALEDLFGLLVLCLGD
jgi:hypothetical protein